MLKQIFWGFIFSAYIIPCKATPPYIDLDKMEHVNIEDVLKARGIDYFKKATDDLNKKALALISTPSKDDAFLFRPYPIPDWEKETVSPSLFYLGVPLHKASLTTDGEMNLKSIYAEVGYTYQNIGRVGLSFLNNDQIMLLKTALYQQYGNPDLGPISGEDVLGTLYRWFVKDMVITLEVQNECLCANEGHSYVEKQAQEESRKLRGGTLRASWGSIKNDTNE